MQRKKLRKLSYAYMRIRYGAKEITALGQSPLYEFWSLGGDWFFSHGRTNQKNPNKNKVVHTTLCTTWARTTTQKIPRFFRGGTKVPLYSHTMSLVEIRLWSYFQNILGKSTLPSLREWDSLLLGGTVWPLSDLCQTKYYSLQLDLQFSPTL